MDTYRHHSIDHCSRHSGNSHSRKRHSSSTTHILQRWCFLSTKRRWIYNHNTSYRLCSARHSAKQRYADIQQQYILLLQRHFLSKTKQCLHHSIATYRMHSIQSAKRGTGNKQQRINILLLQRDILPTNKQRQHSGISDNTISKSRRLPCRPTPKRKPSF